MIVATITYPAKLQLQFRILLLAPPFDNDMDLLLRSALCAEEIEYPLKPKVRSYCMVGGITLPVWLLWGPALSLCVNLIPYTRPILWSLQAHQTSLSSANHNIGFTTRLGAFPDYTNQSQHILTFCKVYELWKIEYRRTSAAAGP